MARLDKFLKPRIQCHANGKFGCEVSRKIGAASAEFKLLHRVWKNASIPKRRKLQIFDAMILSKLRYALSSSWLVKADLRRLDGFEAACLRKMLGIKHSFWSRVSNAEVRKIAGQPPFSETVRSSQLKLLGQVFIDPQKRALRDVAFHAGDPLTPETAAYVRRVGRPKQNWTDQLCGLMRQVASSSEDWFRITRSQKEWCKAAARVPK
jgi:hypothetical protein